MLDDWNMAHQKRPDLVVAVSPFPFLALSHLPSSPDPPRFKNPTTTVSPTSPNPPSIKESCGINQLAHPCSFVKMGDKSPFPRLRPPRK